jgi:hypothetical protein
MLLQHLREEIGWARKANVGDEKYVQNVGLEA